MSKKRLSPVMRLGHAAALMKGNALYPISHVNVKTYSIPENSRICSQENLFPGAMPKYIVLGMVHHEAFTGRRDLSPFNFQHCIYYLSHRACGLSFEQVLFLYDDDVLKNDQTVSHFVEKYRRCIRNRSSRCFNHGSCSLQMFNQCYRL